MLVAKMPALVQALFPGLRWHMGRDQQVLYLTFDDGPSPGITEWVLETLDQYNAKASFFLIGDKVKRHPDTVRATRDAGHTIGNHTHHHRNLWATPLHDWLIDVQHCQQAIQEATGATPTLFRRPYGKITPRATRQLHHAQLDVVMWEVICGDWDATLPEAKVASYATRHCRPGSILVLHDSQKAEPRMRATLLATLDHFSAQGYRFEAL